MARRRGKFPNSAFRALRYSSFTVPEAHKSFSIAATKPGNQLYKPSALKEHIITHVYYTRTSSRQIISCKLEIISFVFFHSTIAFLNQIMRTSQIIFFQSFSILFFFCSCNADNSVTMEYGKRKLPVIALTVSLEAYS